MLPERFEEANINQHIAKITLDGATVDRDFVFQCLQDRKYRVQFERITTGQAYPQISLVQVRDTIIPMPPLDEQRKIALVLSTADHEISALKLRLSALRQEKHALMQQLLTGKRRVNVETEAA
jgi:type I restriction enzyme S subunit